MEPVPRPGVGGLSQEAPPPFDAVVLAGGRATRLGGFPKPLLVFEGASLLERALAAVAGARQAVVVGPGPDADGATPAVRYVLEEPRFGGPLAALGAGVAELGRGSPDGAPWVVVLAVDVPRSADAVPLLLDAAVGSARAAAAAEGGRGPDAIVAEDDAGRLQPLLAAYRRGPLARVLAGLAREGGLTDRPMRDLVARLDLLPLRLPAGLSDDVDTWDAAERWGIGRPDAPGGTARQEDL
ncbi:molybdenum cofactor guanylyltransferase [Sinomonas flava]|uniref:molybdenum cofactor guanylyltransferase n=1 Tax=Sinomonas flava TaxID=496857 RepID=UPI0039A6F523